MRLVLDTNVVVAGLLWNGHPRHLLDLAIDGDVTLFASPALTVRYGALVTLVTPVEVPRVVKEDADDDQVLACAVAAQVNLIVSGDKHLLRLGGSHAGIRIVTAAQAAETLSEAG